MPLGRWLPVLAFVVALLATVFVWRQFAGSERAGFEERNSIISSAIKDSISDNVGYRVHALELLAGRWAARHSLELAEWEAEAAAIIEEGPGLGAVLWLGPGGEVVAEAVATGGQSPGASLAAALDRSGRSGAPAYLRAWEEGFAAFAPIKREGARVGAMAGVFDSQRLVQGILKDSRLELEGYSVLVTGGGAELFRSAPGQGNGWATQWPLAPFGVEWKVEVWPSESLAASSRTVFPSLMLALGSLSSALLATLLFFAQSAVLRGRGLEAANARLRAEIRERERAAMELKVSDEKFRGLVEASSDLIWETDREGRYTYVSPMVRQILGYYPEELLGRRPWELMPADEAEAARQEFAGAASAGRPLRAEGVYSRKDGAAVALDTCGTAVFGPDGELSGYRGVDRDITERRRAQEALGRIQASLANAQRIARIGSWDWDIGRDEHIWSDEIRRIFGAGPGDEATYEAFLGFVHPDDRFKVHNSLAESVTLGKPYSIEHRLLLSGGVEKVVHHRGEIAFGRSGRPERISGAVQDITERKVTEEQLRLYRDHLMELVGERTAELNQLNQKLALEVEIRTRAEEAITRMNEALETRALELENVNKELEAFTYSASHDLQEPLRVISGYVQLLARRYRGRLDAEADEFISYTVDGVARMQKLISDLLHYSRVGKPRILGPVDCSASLARARANLATLIEESGAKVVCEGLPTVLADESQIDQLFMNLLSNAIKYRGESSALVVVRAERRDGGWLFTVKDNGIGIDPRHSDRIFDLFQRLHGKAEFPGTGIGLSICKKVVENHGGRIWVESFPGSGSVFCFTLPGRKGGD